MLSESCSLGRERKLGGTFHLRLNTNSSPIANKYREGKVQSTLERELNVPETAVMQAYGTCAWSWDLGVSWRAGVRCMARMRCVACVIYAGDVPLIPRRLSTRVRARSTTRCHFPFGGSTAMWTLRGLSFAGEFLLLAYVLEASHVLLAGHAL